MSGFNAYAFVILFVQSAIAGEVAPELARFYASAMKNHRKLGTSFPRNKTEKMRNEIATMSQAALEKMFDDLIVSALVDGRGTAGRADSQAVFDIYMAKLAK